MSNYLSLQAAIPSQRHPIGYTRALFISILLRLLDHSHRPRKVSENGGQIGVMTNGRAGEGAGGGRPSRNGSPWVSPRKIWKFYVQNGEFGGGGIPLVFISNKVQF